MVTVIYILVALVSCIGLALLMLLASQAYNMNKGKKLVKNNPNHRSLSDILIHASVVDDGIIACKNGSFMASWIYSCGDNESSTVEEREALSYQFNNVFSTFSSGHMLHFDAIRKSANDYPSRSHSHFPDRISAGIEEERRDLFQSIGTMYEGYFVVTLTWMPASRGTQKLADMMFDDDALETKTDEEITQGVVEQFKRQCSNFESRVSSFVSLKRLKTRQETNEDGSITTFDDLLAWVNYCVTGDDHPIVLPKNPMYIDRIIANKEMHGGVVPKIGDKYVRVVAIDSFPLESTPGMLSALSELTSSYRWSNRFIFLDENQSVALLNKYRRFWNQKVRGFLSQIFNINTSQIDHDAASMVNDADEAISELKSNLTVGGYYTGVIILHDDDRRRIDENARLVSKAITKLGFGSRIEELNAMEAFFGSLPAHGRENVRRPLINAFNFADFIPSSTIWCGANYAPCDFYPPSSPALMSCVTHGHTPFRLNLHHGDIGHTLMIGPTGSGKSTHLALIAAQFLRYRGATVFAFDKGNSLFPLTKAVGGNHFEIGDDDSLHFMPLAKLDTKQDRAWAADWIETILSLNNLQLNPERRNAISQALISMNESDSKTITDFKIMVQDNQIRQAINQYTDDGDACSYLDASDENVRLSNFNTFEIEELMNQGEKYLIPVLLYLFRMIERSLKGQPAMIILDEAWLMLAHPVFSEKIREWLKVMRKNNCAVVLSTQSISDLAQSTLFDVVVESAKTKIFLANPSARDESHTDMYRRMGLNSRQIDIIAAAVPKRQYYYVSVEGRRLYELALGAFALAFTGASDKESIQSIKDLIKSNPDNWTEIWAEIKRAPLYMNHQEIRI